MTAPYFIAQPAYDRSFTLPDDRLVQEPNLLVPGVKPVGAVSLPENCVSAYINPQSTSVPGTYRLLSGGVGFHSSNTPFAIDTLRGIPTKLTLYVEVWRRWGSGWNVQIGTSTGSGTFYSMGGGANNYKGVALISGYTYATAEVTPYGYDTLPHLQKWLAYYDHAAKSTRLIFVDTGAEDTVIQTGTAAAPSVRSARLNHTGDNTDTGILSYMAFEGHVPEEMFKHPYQFLIPAGS